MGLTEIGLAERACWCAKTHQALLVLPRMARIEHTGETAQVRCVLLSYAKHCGLLTLGDALEFERAERPARYTNTFCWRY